MSDSDSEHSTPLQCQLTSSKHLLTTPDILFFCECCQYSTRRKSSLDKHLQTAKHHKQKLQKLQKLQTTEIDVSVGKADPDPPSNLPCGQCQKFFTSRVGLWKHRKTCSAVPSAAEATPLHTQTGQRSAVPEDSEIMVPGTTEKDIIMMLIKQNNDFKTLLMEQQQMVLEFARTGSNSHSHNTTTTNSHNKTFNLQFFLNETCKNAMNLNEFVDTIQLQLSDLERVGEVGYVEGISNIIIDKLNRLDITERPIHCTDKKREILYIKNENKWEREGDDKQRLRSSIRTIANRNYNLLSQFREQHPDCNKSSSRFSDQYNKIIIEALNGDDPANNDKIIRLISRNVVIDKHDQP